MKTVKVVFDNPNYNTIIHTDCSIETLCVCYINSSIQVGPCPVEDLAVPKHIEIDGVIYPRPEGERNGKAKS